MKKKVLKPFDLEKAKAGAEVCTRDGRKARIICFDAVRYDNFPLVTLILSNGEEDRYWHTPQGKGSLLNEELDYDLFLVEYVEEQHNFKPFDKVLVRDTDDEVWRPAFYADYDENLDDPYLIIGCFGGRYKQCIPFEGNEHLVGTTNKPE